MNELTVKPATLFPFFWVRSSGWPRARVRELSLAESVAKMDALITQAAALDTEREVLCNLLHALIASAEGEERRGLIRLRRDLYNDRPRAARSPHLRLLPPQVSERVQRYRSARAHSRERARSLEADFGEAIQDLRAHLVALLRNPLLRRGLSLSSHSLLTGTERYLSAYEGSAPPLSERRRRRVEAACLQYIARMGFRTTPFSTFASVGWGTIGMGPHQPCVAGAIEPPRGPFAELNGDILIDLLEELQQCRTAAMQWPLRRNPSLRIVEGGYRWLHRSAHTEQVRGMLRDPLHDSLLAQLEEREPQHHTQIVQHIEALTDAASQRAAEHVFGLVSCGLLELDFGRLLRAAAGAWTVCDDDQDEIEDPGEAQRGLLDWLQGTRSASEELVRGDAPTRVATCARVREDCARVLRPSTPSGGDAPRPLQLPRAEDVLLETVCDPVCQDLPLEEVQPILDSVARLGRGLWALPIAKPSHRQIARFFCARYGTSRTVALLELFEAYHSHARSESATETLPPSPLDRASLEAEERLRGLLAQGLAGPEGERVLDPQAWPTQGPTAGSATFGALLQFFSPGAAEPPMAVLNQLVPGHGRLGARFLGGLPGPLSAALRQACTTLHSDEIAAELVDAGSWASANRHPPLLPFELLCPGATARLVPARQLRVAELSVVFQDAERGLGLLHEGRRVSVFDLGLADRRHGTLYRFLRALSPTFEHRFQLLKQWLSPAPVQPAEATPSCRPRVYFGRHLVLGRRTWELPRACLPSLSEGDTDLQRLLKLRTLRAKLGVPEECFVRVERPGTGTLSAPQLVSFRNPWCARLWTRIVRSRPTRVLLEELLPEHTPAVLGTDDHALEHLFEWQIEASR